MKRLSHFLLLTIALLLLCAVDMQAKPKPEKVYIFGVSISFTDSVTYFTDIQILQPAYIESKNGFLYDRSIYSQQLQVWVEHAKDRPHTTCMVFFDTNRNKLEKKYVKIRNKYNKDRSTHLKSLNVGEFRFIPLEWTEHEKL